MWENKKWERRAQISGPRIFKSDAVAWPSSFIWENMYAVSNAGQTRFVFITSEPITTCPVLTKSARKAGLIQEGSFSLSYKSAGLRPRIKVCRVATFLVLKTTIESWTSVKWG